MVATHRTEVFILLEIVQVERQKRTDTAVTVANQEPDVAKNGCGGDDIGPSNSLT